jgi:glyoxylase-like metal-dependent hydrolase (beta-lactamase superfamily II)
MSLRVRPSLRVLLALGTLLAITQAQAQLVPGSMSVQWNEGSAKCEGSQPPLQVHPYNARTYILRENLCATFEAPFMYLLLGSSKAVLIDTGDIADPNQMPLATTVMHLLQNGSGTLPLLVVHTHRHLDHRAGDRQFLNLPNVQVVGYDIDSVRRFYAFNHWPDGLAQIDLGDRMLDVIPTPGHNETEVSFYDRNTGLFFSGDFFLPARFLVDDTSAYLASANRVAAFVKDRPVTYVLGAHIEMDAQGEMFPWQSQYHPHEHVLQLSKEDLLGLPTVLSGFNGFYNRRGNFVVTNSIHVLIACAVGLALLLIALLWMLIQYVRRRRARRWAITR